MARATRRKSRRWRSLLVAAALSVALGAPLAYFVGRHFLVRRIASWRQEGLAAAQAGDKARAAEMLLRYLKRRPGDVEALRRYVEVRQAVEMPDGRHLAEAVGALQLLLSEQPDSLDDRRHLLELFVRLDRRPEALDTAEMILRRAPGDVRTAELKTEVLLKDGRDRQALDAAQQWCNAAPQELKAHMARLSLRSRLGHPPARIVADATALREANPGDVRFEILQGFAHGQVGDDDEAGRWLKTASLTVTDEALARVLVEQLDALGLCNDALAVLEGLVARGGSAEMRHALGKRLWELGRWKEASEALADVSPADPGADATLLALKAESQAEQGALADAEACLAALAARPREAEAQACSLLLRRKLRRMREPSGVTAGPAVASADDREIVTHCRAALMLDPQNAYLEYHAGEARARLGEIDLAVEAWRRAVMKSPAWTQPAVRLVDALLLKGLPEQALRIAAGAARRSPANAASVITLARAWAAGVEAGRIGETDELLRLVEQVQKQMPGEEKTLLIQVQMEARSGHKEDAVRAARSAVGLTPAPSEGTLLALSAISRRFGLGLEQQCFDRSEQVYGTTPAVVYARAVDRHISGDTAAGLKLLDDAVSRAGSSSSGGGSSGGSSSAGGPVGRPEWALVRVQYLDLVGDPGAARAWADLVAAYPEDLSVHQASVSARAVRGDWQFQEPVIERLRRIGGDGGLSWRMARARLMVEAPRGEGDYAQGSVLLTQIIREHPLLPEPHVLMARALVRMKRFEAAAEHLSAALRLDPTSVPVALQLAGLLQSRGEFERVRQELDRISPHLRSAEERRQAALLLAQAGNRERAAKLLEEQQIQPGESPQEALLLAAIYRRDRQYEKAEAVVKKLLERPTLGAVVFASSLYASMGRAGDAEKALGLLDGLHLDPGVKQLAVASYLSQAGDAEGAIRKLTEATKVAPSNGVAWRILAAALMARGRTSEALAAVDAGVRAAPSDAPLAEVQKSAAVLAAANDAPELRPLVLSVMRDPSNGDGSADLLRAVVEGRQAHDAERLVARLEQFVERHPTSLPARVQLIEAHRAAGNARLAINAARQAMSAFPGHPAPARLAVQLYAAEGRWADLQTAAQVWRRRAPEEARDIDVWIARSQVGLRQHGAAVALLQPHIAAVGARGDRDPDLVTTYCLALANSKRGDEAEALLWPLAQGSAAWKARWLETALQLSDDQLALRWVNRLAAAVTESAPAEERSLVADAYDQLGARLKDKSLTNKSFELYRSLIAAQGVPADVLVAAASQAERAGDPVTAEAIYRRALGTNSQLAVAWNNLAIIIAARGGDLVEARRAASEAVRLRPREGTFHDTLATVTAKLGDGKAAVESMRAAVRLEPENPQWRVQLAQYLADAGNTAAALEVLEQIRQRQMNVESLPPAVRQQLEGLRKQLRRAGGSARSMDRTRFALHAGSRPV